MFIYIHIYIYKFTSKCHSQNTPSSERRWPGLENVSAPSADKQTHSEFIH